VTLSMVGSKFLEGRQIQIDKQFRRRGKKEPHDNYLEFFSPVMPT